MNYFVVALVMAFLVIDQTNAECCHSHMITYSCDIPLGTCRETICLDGTVVPTIGYCGVGSCNLLGCNCSGGCRKGDLKTAKEKFAKTHGRKVI